MLTWGRFYYLHIGPTSQRGADLSALVHRASCEGAERLPVRLVSVTRSRYVLTTRTEHVLSWTPFHVLATSVVTSDLSTAQRMEGGDRGNDHRA